MESNDVVALICIAALVILLKEMPSYEVCLCAYDEDESTCEKSNWRLLRSFGRTTRLWQAKYIATWGVLLGEDCIASFCRANKCDGISWDVVDRWGNRTIVSYELSATGEFNEWRDDECHEWSEVLGIRKGLSWKASSYLKSAGLAGKTKSPSCS